MEGMRGSQKTPLQTTAKSKSCVSSCRLPRERTVTFQPRSFGPGESARSKVENRYTPAGPGGNCTESEAMMLTGDALVPAAASTRNPISSPSLRVRYWTFVDLGDETKP